MFLSPEIFNLTPPTIALIVAFLVLVTTYYIRRDRGLPSGPIGLPYFGYWFFLKKKGSHLQMQELGKKYGDVFSFRVTGHLLINLGSIKALKEFQVLKSDCFAVRPSSYVISEHVFGGGVSAASGEQSKILRRFLLNAFRECGLNSNATYHDRLNGILEDLGSAQGDPVDISAIVVKRSATIMSNAVFGYQGITEDEVNEFNENYTKLALSLASIKLLLGQVAKYTILPFYSGYHDSKLYSEKLFRFLQQKMAEHASTYDNNHVRDLIDVYIKERKTREQKGDPTAKYFTDIVLRQTLLQIVGDGILSVPAFVNIFFNALLDYPEEQDKMYEEIVEVIGPDRLPTIEDRTSLPYTNAFIYEVIRKSDFSPMLPSVECTTETTIRGYRIPKGAVTLANYWAANHDPGTYDDPETFNPSRFVATSVKPRAELPMLFGVGKRACLGEIYTMTQAFLILTTVVQKFHLSKPSTEDSSINRWQTYVVAQPRKND